MPNRYFIISAVILAIVALIARFIILRQPTETGRARLAAKEIVVGNHTSGTITRYPGNADGDVPPSGEFVTSAGFPSAVAFDASGNLYVASDVGDHVLVYAAGAIMQNTPLRNISGPQTGISHPTGIAVDQSGNVYVANWASTTQQSTVLKFASGTNGDVPPIARIPGTCVSLGCSPGPVNTEFDRAKGIAVDSAERMYVIDALSSKLLIFDPGADGDVRPSVVIETSQAFPQQVTLDGDENIYVTHRSTPPAITVYPANPTNSSAPIRTIFSPDLNEPFGIAVDGADQIYVPNLSQHSLVVFPAGANGNAVTPARKLQGPATGLNRPLTVAVSSFIYSGPSDDEPIPEPQ